jgi:cytochrome c oxidase subunit 1/cytochrome c oxidase subunit I+III
MLNEKMGKWFFWLFLTGFNATFFIQHILGILGMPRRVYTYPDLPWYGLLNLISSGGAFLMGIAALLLLYILYNGIKKGTPAGNDPWDGFTLEWATHSPPPLQNFDSLPPVNSRRPLWNIKHPENPDDE